jgi:PAS domain S-box-containing protein
MHEPIHPMKHQHKTREQVIEELDQAEEALKWLSTTAIELVGFPPERDIYEFICAKTRELVGNAIVSINSIDDENSVLRIRKLAGIGQVKLEKLEVLLGRKILSASFEGVDHEAKHALLSGSLTEVHGGLYRLFFERVPKSVCLVMERLLGIERIYSIGLRRNGSLFGNATIVTQEGARLNRDVLEAFFNQASATLEYRLAERELRESEARLKTVAENVTDIVWIAEIEDLEELSSEVLAQEGYWKTDQLLERWQFTFVSPSAERILGYRAEEMLRLKPGKLLTEASYAKVRAQLAEEVVVGLANPRYMHAQEPIELEHIGKDGQLRWCEITARFLRNEQKKIGGILGVTRDISDRKRAEEALRFPQFAVDHSSEAVFLLRRDGRFVYVNDAACTSLGYSREELLSLTVQDIDSGFPDESWSKHWQDVKRRQSCTLQSQHRAKDGRVFPVDISVNYFEYQGEEYNCAFARDVTERKRAEDALHKEQRLLRQLLDLLERERRLTSYEIHDGLAQHVFGAQMLLQGLEPCVAPLSDAAKHRFGQALRLLAKCGKEARTLISQLRPPILDESGILGAINFLVAEQSHLDATTIEFQHDGPFEDLASALQEIVFRIVQEGLVNACLHSQSTRIHVALVRQNGAIHVVVRDWGRGFDPCKVEENRFGLHGIRERARLFGGKASIDTAPGKGTCVTVELPDVDHFPIASGNRSRE